MNTYGSFRMDGRKGKLQRKDNTTHRRVSHSRSAVIFIAVLLIISATVLLALNCAFYPAIVSLAKVKVQNDTYSMLLSSMSEHMKNNPSVYSDFIDINYDANGNVSSVSANTVNLNLVLTAIMTELFSSLDSVRSFEETIPLGSVFGSDLNSGIGPNLTVRITSARTARAHIGSSFVSCGINQTLHRLTFDVDMELFALMPSGKKEFTVSHSLPIAETIIVGKVPSAYASINRLTEDISETDICRILGSQQ